jgi:hypothetical protein
LATGFILAIAGFVINWRIRVERREQGAHPKTAGPQSKTLTPGA